MLTLLTLIPYFIVYFMYDREARQQYPCEKRFVYLSDKKTNAIMASTLMCVGMMNQLKSNFILSAFVITSILALFFGKGFITGKAYVRTRKQILGTLPDEIIRKYRLLLVVAGLFAILTTYMLVS